MRRAVPAFTMIALATSLATALSAQDPVDALRREEAALEFVREHHKELADLLIPLKTMDREQYDAAIRDLARTRENIERLEKRDPDRARRPRDRHGDLVGDRLAQRRQAERPAPALGVGENLRVAQGVADGAQAFEIGLAGEVEAVRLDRRRRRHEQCPQADAIARLQRWLGAARADPDPGRRRVRLKPFDHRSVGFALLNALTITSYTLVDGFGARASGAPLQYAVWLFLLSGAVMGAYGFTRIGWRLSGDFVARWRLTLGGAALSTAAYAIAIWAMTVAPIALVAALRETSVLFAALLATVLLREPVLPTRILAAFVVLVGMVLLRLR